MVCPDWAYVNRNRVERLWGRLKEWGAVAARYQKTAHSFKGVLCLAASTDRLRHCQGLADAFRSSKGYELWALHDGKA